MMFNERVGLGLVQNKSYLSQSMEGFDQRAC